MKKMETIKRGYKNEQGEFVFELQDPSISHNRVASIDDMLKHMKGKEIAEFLLQRILI